MRDGGGFEPFGLGLSRAWCSALILFGIALLARQRVRLTRRELGILALSGLIVWTGGNGLVTVGQQRMSSGLAALMIAATPIWVTLMESALDRRLPSARQAVMLLVGFAGVVLLSYPVLREGVRADVLSVLALLGAGVSWGGGSLLQARKRVEVSGQVSASVQMFAGGVGFLVMYLVTGESPPDPAPEAIAAWGYLVVFGGVIAFVSYVTVLRSLPMSLATTYGYINPVIALVLGYLVLGEPITGWTVAGSALVLLGVAGIFRTRAGIRTQA